MRDPKISPQPGDRFIKGTPKGFIERQVLSIAEGRVEFIARGNRFTTSLAVWRDWVVDAKFAKSI
jgi:hypothetical protein